MSESDDLVELETDADAFDDADDDALADVGFDADADADDFEDDDVDDDVDVDVDTPAGDADDDDEDDVVVDDGDTDVPSPTAETPADDEPITLPGDDPVLEVEDDNADDVDGLKPGEVQCASCFMVYKEKAIVDKANRLCRDCA